MIDRGRLEAALPGYVIGAELGRGAFGAVVQATHRQLGRQVAVKQLPVAFAADPDVRRRFTAEAKLLGSLDHPHIVPIFDYVEKDGLCALVMELLPGGTVRAAQREGLTHQRACAIALATCAALDYAHERGILHRDIKPDNLLFTQSRMLKVTDFGIAKVVGETAATRAGETLGTPAYMAPEQCLGEEVGPATDIYATGVMLYELLSGQLPFPDDGNALAVLYRHVHEAPRALEAIAPGVPSGIAYVVMRALSKSPADRHPSAEAFGVALAEAATTAWGIGWLAAAGLKVMAVGPMHAATERASQPTTVVGDGAARDTDEPVTTAELRPRSTGRRRRVGIVAAVIGAVVAVGAVVALVAGGGGKSGPTAWKGDPLTGPVDRRHWTPATTLGATMTANNGTSVTLSPSPQQGEESGVLTTTCSFHGDFDVAVSYALQTWPPGSLGRLGIIAPGHGSVQRINQPDADYYVLNPNIQRPPVPQLDLLGTVTTTDLEGGIRLQRKGTTVSGYDRNNASAPWSLLASATVPDTPTPIVLKIWADQPGVVRAASFSNFEILGGSCV